MGNYIFVDGNRFKIVDTREKITVADSFVIRANKIGSGNGEAKFYIGNESTSLREFFNGNAFEDDCFLLKKDLLKYLDDAKDEYLNPQQPYLHKADFAAFWQTRYESISTLPDVLNFKIKEQTQVTPPRIYVNSKDRAYKLIREISLPNITYLSVIKLEGDNGGTLYYFRPFVDYFDDYEHPYVIEQEEEKIMEESDIAPEDKDQIIRARKGQGKYRLALLEECPFCPITLISDDRLLIASHIKPWAKSETHEKTDPKNGFMLTPTYDLLFDRGFISFTDDKKLLISPWLSKMTCSKLGMAPNKLYSMLPTEGREGYLEYHRTEIFKS